MTQTTPTTLDQLASRTFSLRRLLRMGIAPRTDLEEAVRSGELPSYRLANRVRVAERDVADWLHSKRVERPKT